SHLHQLKNADIFDHTIVYGETLDRIYFRTEYTHWHAQGLPLSVNGAIGHDQWGFRGDNVPSYLPRVEFDDEIGFHHHRIGHLRRERNPGEPCRHFAVVNIKIFRHIAFG